ncbi:17-beta-hydroxysteroid dehydrogenase type 2 [Macaca nemestrina]|uniref:17-beta hydroxysteroid dehydrogenase 2 n=5 Tax=Macaca TaxID=9539 RepID=Q4JK76_MACFA|nr:estradiol 17-beta-dehydrogenase 2 [Macaca nemestrina]AAY84567.1 17-beta hydroxysteroid dehydrogenase 2 [Macaca fascicularis]EHH31895.1 Estradiol 17-beta-dehydrogenase 2 [Macaca mulatta]
MSTFFSDTTWICLAVPTVLCGTVFCKYKKSSGQLWNWMVCLAGLCAVCLLILSPFWGLILFSLSCFLMYTYLSGQELLPVDQKAVLVTGGDCGLGHALCKYLDELGFTVFAGVLNENGPGAEELRRTCSPRLSVLQMDVTKPVQIKDAYSKVAAMLQDRGLWAVVNNAGVLGFPSDGELLPMTDYKQCMAVNFFGTVEVTKTFLPLLRKSKGRLVNVSSMGGGAPMAKLASYGSSKAAVTMFSSVMRIELSKWGIKVVSIQPGGFRTSIAGTSDKWEKLEKDILDHLPAEVQEDYGQDYILSQKNFLLFINSGASTDFSPVLRDIQHAISAKSPFAYYTPGKAAYLWLCLAFYLPIGIYNYFAERNFGKDEPMPRALSMPNYKRKAT